MRNYTPFLKMKVNEIAALKELPADVFPKIVPFFDLPHDKDRTPAGLDKLISDSAKKMKKISELVPRFFVDLYDIPDSLSATGSSAFNAVANYFQGQDFIPVIGLDRSAAYISSVFLNQSSGLLESKTLAIRLVEEDYESYAACKDDIFDLISDAKDAGFKEFILVLDMRICISKSPLDLAHSLSSTINAAIKDSNFKSIVISGSSITAQIGEIVQTETEALVDRVELKVFNLLRSFPESIVGFGDYTIVSPAYSDTDFAKELLRNVTAPKVCYSYDDFHYINRGGALKSHPRGDAQYNDIAATLVKEPFFRSAGYSFGENFLVEKAASKGKAVTPSSILKPTICAHLTYMVRGHPLFV